jgi:hypothetical protein
MDATTLATAKGLAFQLGYQLTLVPDSELAEGLAKEVLFFRQEQYVSHLEFSSLDAVAPRRLPAACCPNDRVIVPKAGIYSAGKLVPGDSRYEKMAEEPIGRFQV